VTHVSDTKLPSVLTYTKEARHNRINGSL